MICCPTCATEAPDILGVLGWVYHLRCTNCGMQFSVQHDRPVGQPGTPCGVGCPACLCDEVLYDDVDEIEARG